MQIRLIVVAAIIFAGAVALAYPGTGAVAAGGSIQIQTCSDPNDPNTCQQQAQPVQQQPSPKRPPASSQPAPESHTLNLKSGDQQTSSSEGDSLSLNLKARDADGNLKPATPAAPPPPPQPGLPPVSTQGGSVAGGASPFDFVNTDQALASFEVPPFLLPIYVSAGRAYDVPWNVLASINKIETDFGRLGACVRSSAGAEGWMQFMPSTWATYGVDASGDGFADPCNPVDAIYAAARYLRASGAPDDLHGAILSYNHAEWYVQEVLHTASVYGSLPGGLVTETGSLAFGHFPVRGSVSYGDDFRQAQLAGQAPTGISLQPSAKANAVATQDATVTRVLISPELAKAFRNDPAQAAETLHSKATKGASAPAPPTPAPQPAAATTPSADSTDPESGEGSDFAFLLPVSRQVNDVIDFVTGRHASAPPQTPQLAAAPPPSLPPAEPAKADAPKPSAIGSPQLAAAPAKPATGKSGSESGHGPVAQPSGPQVKPGSKGLPDGFEVAKGEGVGVVLTDPVGNQYRYEGLDKLSPELRPGASVDGGQVLGPLRQAKPMVFSLTAAGGAPVDPRPIIDGYRLQEAANYFHAVEPVGGNPFLPDLQQIATGVISGDQAQLGQRVLSDPGISIYPCGRQDIEHGLIDRRVLGALLYLRRAGMTLTITSLRCGHSFLTASGNVSAHSYGAAVDIAAFNGQPVLGHQGPGSLTEQAIKLLMQLQGAARPAQLISLMTLGGPSFALSDHDDHLHVGYSFSTSITPGRSGNQVGAPVFGGTSGGGQGLSQPEHGANAQKHEEQLSQKLGQIKNPSVPDQASPGASKVGEGERRSEVAAAKADHDEGEPLPVHPSSSGAQMVAIDVPAGSSGQAYGLGLVSGAAQGWDEHQVVAMAYRGGAWSVIGPPTDASGKVVNPKLSALATLRDGRGYAVGKDGAVVALRGDQPPLALASSLKSDLEDVSVDTIGGKPVGYAVGTDGTAARLAGNSVSREKAGGSQTSLSSVALDGSEPVAVGAGAGGPVLAQRQADGNWSASSPDFGLPPSSNVELDSVAANKGETWVSGSVADSAGTPLKVPFVAHQAGGGWDTYCSANPALSVVEELGRPTASPCAHGLPSSTPGTSASAIAITADGPIVASGGVLVPLNTTSKYRATAAASGPIVDLASAFSRTGGFALGPQGSLISIGPEAAAAPATVQALPLGNAQPVLVAAQSSDRAAALGAGKAAIWNGDEWAITKPTQIAVRDVAWQDDGDVWAIDELGTPVQLGSDGWSAPGEDSSDREQRAALASAIGGNPLTSSGGSEQGLRSLAFTADGSGLAAGHGALASFGGGDWSFTSSNVDLNQVAVDINDVAAGSNGFVAAGDHGTLIDGQVGNWSLSSKAGDLVHDADLTAVAVADDGTEVAAGGGAVLVREPDASDWSAMDLPPLGIDVQKLAAVRDSGGGLVVVALVDSGGQLVALRGTDGGWQPIALPAGVTPSDLSPIPGTGKVMLGGDRYGSSVAITIDAGAAPAASAAPHAEGN